MRRILLLWVLTILMLQVLLAQSTDRRFSFAKTYYGLDVNYISAVADASFLNTDNQVNFFDRSSLLSPAFNLGATHFWGHADFYISIPLRTLKLGTDEVDNQLSQRVFTGLRLYPLKLSPNTVRPYVGYKFSAHRYRQSTLLEQEIQYTEVKSILDVGIGYRLDNVYAYLGYNTVINPAFSLPLARTEAASSRFPSSFVTLGVNLELETTNTKRTESFIQLMNELESTNRHGFFFGIGPSSAFTLTDSPRITENYPFLDQRAMPSVFPDLSVGYHFSKWDLISNLAFRPITINRNALDFEQRMRRRSLVLEFLKGLGDYHGFVPFIGVGMGYENIRLLEKDGGTTIYDQTFEKVTPILTFGWDIRPNRQADWLILRTNLRYAHWLNINSGTDQLNINQLEFNFIQIAIYPHRKNKY